MKYIVAVFALMFGITASALELLPIDKVYQPAHKDGCMFPLTSDIEFTYAADSEFNNTVKYITLVMSEMITVITEGERVQEETKPLSLTARQLSSNGTLPVTCIRPGIYKVFAIVDDSVSNTLEFTVKQLAPTKEETDEKDTNS